MAIQDFKQMDGHIEHQVDRDILGNVTRHRIVYYDHLGNAFIKIGDALGIHHTFVAKRLNKGIKLDIALEKKMTKSEVAECFKNKYYMDHVGHSFSSFQAMCNYWKKSSSFVKYRLEHGKSLQEALEEIINI